MISNYLLRRSFRHVMTALLWASQLLNSAKNVSRLKVAPFTAHMTLQLFTSEGTACQWVGQCDRLCNLPNQCFKVTQEHRCVDVPSIKPSLSLGAAGSNEASIICHQVIWAPVTTAPIILTCCPEALGHELGLQLMMGCLIMNRKTKID